MCKMERWCYIVAVFVVCSINAQGQSTSPPRVFVCDNGDTILQEDLCDGAANCSDGSDETANACRSMKCPSYAFRCNYGGCIEAHLKCNGVDNCADASDETPCSPNSCKTRQFRCNDGQCIDQEFLCDGRYECEDGSDETSEVCQDFPCPSYALRCRYGACVPMDALCNGIADCADASDEVPPMCDRVMCLNPEDCQNAPKCRSREFQCDSGDCILQEKMCDGSYDCADKSDETETACSKYRCPSYAYSCSYGGCLPQNLVSRCDKNPECPDSSDESASVCGKPVDPSMCLLPRSPPNGMYQLGGCETRPEQPTCRAGHGYPAPPFSFLSFQCSPGYQIDGAGSQSYCTGASWNPPIPNCTEASTTDMPSATTEMTSRTTEMTVVTVTVPTQRTSVFPAITQPTRPTKIPDVDPGNCPPPSLVSNANVRCENKYGEKIKCDSVGGLPEGSTATYICKPYYTSSMNPYIYCLEGGLWSYGVYYCEPECGKKVTLSNALITGGILVDRAGEWPWHGGLYLRDPSGGLIFQCGISLLKEKAVLTAAHCIYGKRPDMLEVMFGKNYSRWDAPQDKPYAQKIPVAHVIPHKSYIPKTHDSDIAILILQNPVQITLEVRPICLDKLGDSIDDEDALREGQHGVLVGWGMVEPQQPGGSKKIAETLRMAKLPYIIHRKCLEADREFYSDYVKSTTFCAGYLNGTSACNGDSGGGLVFPDEHGIWYVRGVVSLSPPQSTDGTCNENKFTVFTKVSSYMSWIQRQLALARNGDVRL